MKTFHSILSILLLTLIPGQEASAQQLPGGKVSLLNKEVKKAGNYVNVNMDMNIDQLNVKSNKGTVIIPMIVNRDDTVKLPAVEIMGRKRYIYYQRTGKTATGNPAIVEKYTSNASQTIHYSSHTPYREWMENSQLVIGQDACGCNQAIVEKGLLQQVGDALLIC